MKLFTVIPLKWYLLFFSIGVTEKIVTSVISLTELRSLLFLPHFISVLPVNSLSWACSTKSYSQFWTSCILWPYLQVVPLTTHSSWVSEKSNVCWCYWFYCLQPYFLQSKFLYWNTTVHSSHYSFARSLNFLSSLHLAVFSLLSFWLT